MLWYFLAHLGANAGVLLTKNKERWIKIDRIVRFQQIEKCLFLTKAIVRSSRRYIFHISSPSSCHVRHRNLIIRWIQQIPTQIPYQKPYKEILDNGKISTTLTLVTSEPKHQNIIICGSFFLMREAWGFFDKKYL